MLRSLLGAPLLLLALAVDLVLSAELIGSISTNITLPVWLLCHALASVLATVAIVAMVGGVVPGRRWPLRLFIFSFCFFIPFAGGVGIAAAVLLGATFANSRYRVPEFWQFTRNIDLPYTAPLNRQPARLDSRGMVEQLMFEEETDQIYKKVLASRNIRNTESATILKTAVGHSNERIRLSAFQALDKKVSSLNRAIQRLERETERSSGEGQANTYLQIATNYLELLTLEDDEPIARAQLLTKAAAAALESIHISSANPNAHFTYGKITLLQHDTDKANAAFSHAVKLGMSEDKVLPYLAESAFKARDLAEVKNTLERMDAAFTRYPPLRQVAEFWT